MEIVQILCRLSKDWIRWPNAATQNKTADSFFRSTGYPDCVGAIDGTHIDIKGQADAAYVNRKQRSSLILQACVDQKMRLTDIFIGWPGSAHDARVFRNSPLGELLKHRPDSVIAHGRHIIGDKAYPVMKALLPPYKDNGQLSEVQKNFNLVHNRCRCVVERSFARLKGKFR
jgi:hypothetical protein